MSHACFCLLLMYFLFFISLWRLFNHMWSLDLIANIFVCCVFVMQNQRKLNLSELEVARLKAKVCILCLMDKKLCNVHAKGFFFNNWKDICGYFCRNINSQLFVKLEYWRLCGSFSSVLQAVMLLMLGINEQVNIDIVKNTINYENQLIVLNVVKWWLINTTRQLTRW